MRPPAVFIDGASGAGKTTLAHMLSSERSDMQYVRRYTTRARRTIEDDAEYHFVSMQEFDNLASRGEFIEYKHYEFGMSYGIRASDIISVQEEGKIPLAICNLGNATTIRSKFPNSIQVLIDVPLEELESRIRARGKNNAEQIAERLTSAERVAAMRGDYDSVVTNVGPLPEVVHHLSDTINQLLDEKSQGWSNAS